MPIIEYEKEMDWKPGKFMNPYLPADRQEVGNEPVDYLESDNDGQYQRGEV